MELVFLYLLITFSVYISLWKNGALRRREFRSCDSIAREEEGETRIPSALPERRGYSVHVTRETRFRALPLNFNPRHEKIPERTKFSDLQFVIALYAL